MNKEKNKLGMGLGALLSPNNQNKNNINKILEQTVPNSLGQFYERVTQYLGFNEFGDEYKVMGLSAYGKPKYYNQIKEIIGLDSKGLIKINPNPTWKKPATKANKISLVEIFIFVETR